MTRLKYQVNELQKTSSGVDTWVCKVRAMGENFVATGGSKAVAKYRVIEKCTNNRDGSDFFCKSVNCEQ